MKQHVEYGYLPDFNHRIIWTTELIARRMASDHCIPLYARYVSEPHEVTA